MGATVLGSIILAGISVSTVSAGAPARVPSPAGDTVDASIAAVPAVSAGGEYIVQLEHWADVDDVVADVAADGVEVTGTIEGAIDAFTATLDAAAPARNNRPLDQAATAPLR
jgi:hypothetical protein